MSYRGGYRGPADRSRSPPRFADRRSSIASAFDTRHPGPSRNNGNDAPRGPRSQFDGPPVRGPPPGGLAAGGPPRTLRDAPPLGSSDRARPFRERDYPERRERSPPPVLPRDRSPPRKFNEARDFPPRDIDVRSARRSSRDGPPSAGSNYSDNAPFASAPTFRGGFRGKARGDFFDRGSSRGGRRNIDDRGDLFGRRERSPPPRFGRDLSRDGREPERRDDRRFERRDDERRGEWLDREREVDRTRRDLPPGRLESRGSADSMPTTNTTYPAPAAPPINPERLAIIESSGADTSMRRPSSSQLTQPKRDPPPETPSYLNGRAETTANRYGSRGSSPPTQAPPVPAFSFSIAPTSSNQGPPTAKVSTEPRSSTTADAPVSESHPAPEERPAPPANAPTAPKAAPVAPKAHHASPPPSAPKAPRALELDATIPPSNRLQGVRSMESLPPSTAHHAPMAQHPGASRQALPHLSQTTSPNVPSASRFPEFAAPTAPKAIRPPTQTPVSPCPPFTSPRTEAGDFQGTQAVQRSQTPPPSAPSGPRKRSFSVSPKVPASSIPTAPKAIRAPPVAPRTGDRPIPPIARSLDRQGTLPPFAPSGPRSHQWNQWRRPGPAVYGEKLGPAIPAKRDSNGEEKDGKHSSNGPYPYMENRAALNGTAAKGEEQELQRSTASESAAQPVDRMNIDHEPSRRRPGHADGQSAAQTHQSFFGKTMDKSSEDEIASSSDDDELDDEEDATLLEAKHARKERELRGQMVDLSTRDYRATSPLESIARLARLSVKDIERHNSQCEDEMDVDETNPESAYRAQPVIQTSESDDGPDVVTPQGEQNALVHVREQDDAVREVRRVKRPTPEAIALPYLLKGEDVRPLHEIEAVQDNIRVLDSSVTDIEAVLEDDFQAECDVREDAEADFEAYYKQWREECEDFDREKEELEKLERQASLEPGPEVDTLVAAPLDPIAQSRRLLKHSSEYELELVLKQSEETARIEQEKLDREAKKVQADMEKEARLPDQETEEAIARLTIVDANRLRDPEALTLVFSYEPPADTFTEDEQQLFIAAFKDTPKKWGEIASLLPGKTYKDCIHHYYANKWDNRFRDTKGKKFRGGRRGRGGKASRPSRGSALMADLNRNEDLGQANDQTTGRPKRAAAPTTFGEREVEAKGPLATQSPAKKMGPGGKDATTEAGEKPVKKQRRAPGEAKPGRKAKSQLASLAAAPSMSPNKPFIQSEQAREQNLRDAQLLAGLQAGSHGMIMPEHSMVFSQHHEAYMPEETDRLKAAAPAAKQSASSYWSVPEQTDFFKYIAHFGTDFAAIASHMGTKTQTMIKNHYQRQIDGGRADLGDSANNADARRERGEDIGPPPTPTPIVKRKYENPQSGGTPRALAPQTEAMDIDEPLQGPPSSISKHASPPGSQFQTKPRFPTSAQSTPIPAQRVVPSPLPTVSTPVVNNMPPHRGQHSALQHPEGSRLARMMDSGPVREPRPSFASASGFRGQPESDHVPLPPRSQPPPGPVRTPSNPADPQYITNLQKEQERAMQLQHQQEQQMRQPQHMMLPHTHGSPASQPLITPVMDRKPMLEERVPTPPRSTFPPSGASRASIFAPMGMNPMTTPGGMFPSRGSYNSSTPKYEVSRPGSVTTSASLQPPPAQIPAPIATPAPVATPAPEPPKRSNVMSLLNSEPEETNHAPKRDSLPSVPARIASPAPSTFPPTSAPQQMSNLSSRREQFGQPSMPHSHFHRPSLGQHGSSTPNATPASLKQETSQGSASSIQQPPKHEWPPRVLGPGNHASPPHPAPLDREPRPPFYQPHRSMMSHLGPQRVNPSPPPSQHSRTSSLSGQQQGVPPREQRPGISGPPPGGPHPSTQSLHSNPYANQQQFPPFSQAPAQAQNRAHHSHNNSLTEVGAGLQRVHGSGREEHFRREEEVRIQRERDEQQARYEAISRERSRQEEAQRREAFHAQRYQEHEMERQRQQQQQQQAYPRGPMQSQPLGPPSYSSPFGAPRVGHGGIREQSQREVETLVAQQAQERRMIEDHERRRQQEHQQMPPQPFIDRRETPADPYRRRPEDAMFPSGRNTPYGGPYSQPPPPRR
ncbi:hypothetical protein CLAFUW4_06814 [Fulvia fulva]|nr:hypothetical protein CLAFUR4_06822 [Fulvia fulva]WPV15929.1 hypothetical protein CLAFUW4_06814 [Fulvia fulva]WPV30851.1 hypothetical protein CLAFUW7_06813 [Fulvia fulva]